MATCTAKSSGDAIENHEKSNIVEIKCQDAKAEEQLRWQRDIKSLLHDLGVGCERHPAGQKVIVYLHTAHVHGCFWRLSIHAKCLPQDVNMHVATFVKAAGS